MRPEHDKEQDHKQINEIGESDNFRSSSSNSATNSFDPELANSQAVREVKNIELGVRLEETHTRRIKGTRHWISVFTAWAVWGAALLAGGAVLFVFLWNYLASDRFTWLDAEKISDLKFIIGVTSINAVGLYIQWLRSQKQKE